MIRLNNKDFTEDELERLIDLVNKLTSIGGADVDFDEIKNIVKGTTLRGGEKSDKPIPIEWCFKFMFMWVPKTFEEAKIIKQAMRSVEVNEHIKRKFNNICRDEVNWYYSGIKGFGVETDSSER